MKRAYSSKQRLCRVRVPVKKAKRTSESGGHGLPRWAATVLQAFLVVCVLSLTITLALYRSMSPRGEDLSAVDAAAAPFEDRDPPAPKADPSHRDKDKWKHPDSALINKLVEGHEIFKKRQIAESRPERLGPIVVNRPVTQSKYSRTPTLFPPRNEVVTEKPGGKKGGGSREKSKEDLSVGGDGNQGLAAGPTTATPRGGLEDFVQNVAATEPVDLPGAGAGVGIGAGAGLPPVPPADALHEGLGAVPLTRRTSVTTSRPLPTRPRDTTRPPPEMGPGAVMGAAAGAKPGVGPPGGIFQGDVRKASMRDIDAFLNHYGSVYNFSMAVSPTMIDKRQVKLPEVLPNIKNPCWLEEVPSSFHYGDSAYRCHVNYRKVMKGFDFLESLISVRNMRGSKWRMRCFPYFMLIGVPKCGTGDLFDALSLHPNILESDIKEPEYWARQRFSISPYLFSKECMGDKQRVSFAEYLDIYDKGAEHIRVSLNKKPNSDNLYSNFVFGDYSIRTFTELQDWDRNLEAPQFVSAHFIYNIRPETKFIVMLRDPVERAISHYNGKVVTRKNSGHGTAHDFHMRMYTEVKDTSDCLRHSSRRFCVYTEDFGRANYHAMLTNGMYSVYLSDWLSIVPQNNLYVLLFEDYITNRVSYLDDIAAFLGLDHFPDEVVATIEKMPVLPLEHHLGDMMNETRTLLRDFYRPFNTELGKILQSNRFSWGY